MLTLRPYQNQAIAAIYGYFESNKGTLIVIPTAGGKSLVMAGLHRWRS